MAAHARVYCHTLDCAVLGEPLQAHPARLGGVCGMKFSDGYAVTLHRNSPGTCGAAQIAQAVRPGSLADTGQAQVDDTVADASIQGGGLVDLGAFFVREFLGRVLDAADEAAKASDPPRSTSRWGWPGWLRRCRPSTPRGRRSAFPCRRPRKQLAVSDHCSSACDL
jgi:hypothetical protein